MNDYPNSEVRLLRSRAASLTAQAKTLPPTLATTYRRRAQELELEAFLLEVTTPVAAG